MDGAVTCWIELIQSSSLKTGRIDSGSTWLLLVFHVRICRQRISQAEAQMAIDLVCSLTSGQLYASCDV